MINALLLTVLLLLAAVPAKAMDLTDIWYNPAESGWGVNLVQSYDFLFATFFIYGSNGLPTWYTAQMTWDEASSAFKGPLYATTGTGFAFPWQPGNFSIVPVGNASFALAPNSAYRGTLSYSVTAIGANVLKQIERQTLKRIELGGAYSGAQYGEYYNCTDSTRNRTYVDTFDLDVTLGSDNRVTLSFAYGSDLTCTLTGTVEQHGSLYRIPLVPGATYRCSDGLDTTANVYELKATSMGIEGRFFAPSVGLGCSEVAKFSAVYVYGSPAQ
jgi:hypothetical protein